MTGKIELSIIIVNFNVKELLLNCIQSIVETTTGIDYEVIVVDNASRDDSVYALRHAFPDMHLIANSENLGFAVANNQGYEICRGEYILLLNPDTIVMPGAIKTLLEFMKATPDCGLAACRLLNPDGSLQKSIENFPTIKENLLMAVFLDRLFLDRHRRRTYYRDKPYKIDSACGACLMVRRKALVDMPLLSPDFFMYAEEKDLALRLKKKGWNTYFVPYGEVIHYGGMSSSQMPVEIFLELQKSQVRFFRIHYSKIYAWVLAISWGLVLLSNLMALLLLFPVTVNYFKIKLFTHAVMHYPIMLKNISRKA